MVSQKTNIRKAFEVFGKGVQRLEELEAELNALDIKGHETEAAAIKAKLKNVSEIPDIERRLKILKAKISGKYKPKKRAKPKKDLLEAKIKEIEKQVKVKSKVSSNKSAAYSRKMSKIQKELDSLKRQADKQRRDEERKKRLLQRIDPSVDITVNELFGLSLEEIKGELSRKIKEKETELQKQLRQNVEAKEQEYKIKGEALREKYHQKYLDKVKRELDKEIRKKFGKLMKQSIKRQKVKLSKEELRRFREKAQTEFDKRIEQLKSDFEHNLTNSREGIKQYYEEELLLQKHLLHKAFEQRVGNEVANLNRLNRQREKEVIDRLKENKLKELDKEFEKRKLDLEKELELRLAFANKQKDKIKASSKKREVELRLKIKEEEKLLELLKTKSGDAKRLLESKLKVLVQQEREKENKLRKKLSGLKNKNSFIGQKLKKELKDSSNLLREKESFFAKKLAFLIKKDAVLIKKDAVLIKKTKKNFAEKLSKEKNKEAKLAKMNKGKDIQLYLKDKSVREMKGMINNFRKKIKEDKIKLVDEINKINELREVNSKLEQNYLIKEAKMKEKLNVQKEAEINGLVKKRVVLMRKSMEREFEKRLKSELEAKEAALQRKKFEIEQEIQRKAKMLFS